eukprot:3565413-Rhodomonas_salina.1
MSGTHIAYASSGLRPDARCPPRYALPDTDIGYAATRYAAQYSWGGRSRTQVALSATAQLRAVRYLTHVSVVLLRCTRRAGGGTTGRGFATSSCAYGGSETARTRRPTAVYGPTPLGTVWGPSLPSSYPTLRACYGPLRHRPISSRPRPVRTGAFSRWLASGTGTVCAKRCPVLTSRMSTRVLCGVRIAASVSSSRGQTARVSPLACYALAMRCPIPSYGLAMRCPAYHAVDLLWTFLYHARHSPLSCYARAMRCPVSC